MSDKQTQQYILKIIPVVRLGWLAPARQLLLLLLKGDRYPRQLFDQVREVKPHRGRQRKMWGKRVDDIFEALLLDKEEFLDGIKKRDVISSM